MKEMSKMVNSLLIMETQLEYCQFYKWQKLFITEAIVSDESYLGNLASLFRPSKVSTILKRFFWSPLQSEIFFSNITDLLLQIAFFTAIQLSEYISKWTVRRVLRQSDLYLRRWAFSTKMSSVIQSNHS